MRELKVIYLVERVVDVVDSASVVGRVVAADVGLIEDLTGRLWCGGGGFRPIWKYSVFMLALLS